MLSTQAGAAPIPDDDALSGNPYRRNYQTAIVQRILTGGQADNLVAIFGGNAGIIEGQILAGLYKIIEILLVGGIRKLVIGEAFSIIAGGLEHGKDLICMVLCQGVEENQAVVVPGLNILPSAIL